MTDDKRRKAVLKRAEELVHVITHEHHRLGREFTMRIPAEPERDADLVFSEVIRMARAAHADSGELVASLRAMLRHDNHKLIEAMQALAEVRELRAWIKENEEQAFRIGEATGDMDVRERAATLGDVGEKLDAILAKREGGGDD